MENSVTKSSEMAGNAIYEELGVTPVISAIGYATVLGGSHLSPRVRAAMDGANSSLVDMRDLSRQAGHRIARLLEAPASHITTGAAGALVLAAGACMAGDDPEKIRRLPAIASSKCDVLVQRAHRYRYDRCVEVAGAHLREVGSKSGATRAAHLEAAVDQGTAAILFPAHLDELPGTISLEETLAIARACGVPLILDAAAIVYPIERMKRYARDADLVCLAAKYFRGPGATGVLAGRVDLVASAALQDFMSFEFLDNLSFGRAMKVDRQAVVGTVVALSDWLELDHAARLRECDRKMAAIADELSTCTGVSVTRSTSDTADRLLCLHLRQDGKRSAAGLAAALRAGNPSIWVRVQGDELVLSMSALQEGDDQIIASRLATLLSE
jgi:L-seryl-tRNA(Ser) seleniumtransferase